VTERRSRSRLVSLSLTEALAAALYASPAAAATVKPVVPSVAPDTGAREGAAFAQQVCGTPTAPKAWRGPTITICSQGG